MDSQTRLQLYLRVLELHYRAKLGHIGPSLSCVDIMGVLWLSVMQKTDRFILSKGHAATTLYAVLAQLGKLTPEELATFHADGTALAMHPTPQLMGYSAFPTGSLGHGLSLSAGMAQAMAWKAEGGKPPRVFCLMSDGECNVGQTWEAAAYIGAKRITNVVTMIDKNGWQAFGRTGDVLGDGATPARWQSFGFEAVEVNGHDVAELTKAFVRVRKNRSGKPMVIIANTVKGYGVSYMEDTLDWHYWPMDEQQYAQAVADVRKKIGT